MGDVTDESERGLSDLDDQLLILHQLLEAMPDGVAVLDEDGVIRDVNTCLTSLIGYSSSDLIGKDVASLVPSRDRADFSRQREEYRPTYGVRQIGAGDDAKVLRRDGVEVAVDARLSSLDLVGRSWTVVTVRDSTAKETAQRVLSDSERRFRLAFEDNMAPMIFTDMGDRIIAANDAFCQMLGFDREELLGFDSKPFTYPDDLGITEESHRRISHGEAEQLRYQKRYLHKNGSLIVAEVSKSPARDAKGQTLYYVISERDVTETFKKDRLLMLLSAVNKLAIHVSSESVFLQELCDVLVEEGGYALAWIGRSSPGVPGGVDVAVAAGATDYLYGDMVSWHGTKESGLGPTGTALRTGESQIVRDTAADTSFSPWRERAADFGFGSSVAIPGAIDSQRAVLNIYSREAQAFDESTVKGLEEIVREARFAVMHVRSVRNTEAALEATTLTMKALREAEETLAESEQRFRIAFESNVAPMVFSDHDDLAIDVNEAFCQMVGFAKDELIGHDSKQFTYPDDVGITEETHLRLTSEETDDVVYTKRYLRKDGRVIVAEVSRSAARDADGKVLYFLSSERDVTEERALTAQLSHQALHDPLTGLANRTLFEDRLSQAYARVVRQDGFAAVLSLDLDDFKGVNDTHGHLVGDQLLVGIARRLELVTRASDTLCRLGGDEFLYLAEGLTSAAEAEGVADRLLDVMTEPFTFSGFSIEQRVSIGVVVFDETNANYRETVQGADVALYEAKRRRRGRHVVFDPSMHEHAIHRFSLIQELRHALSVGDLSMHYQPIFDLNSSHVVGFEALMRWLHPEKGWISPDVFIPLAEQSDLIMELGLFSLGEAVAAASAWTASTSQSALPYVTVNLSAHQFHNQGLLSMVEEALASSGLSPERLIIEITERVALLDASETMGTMSQLHRIGVGIALDDFGTGYSSLSYLALLSPSIIKIDQSFVSPSLPSDQIGTLLEAIVSLGHKLNTTVLAEGIETPEQYERLRRLGCELGQGFLMSRAVPASDVATILSQAPGYWER
ncbi:MAG: sensor domain-containing protein [Acidimicrobiales bacterium]